MSTTENCRKTRYEIRIATRSANSVWIYRDSKDAAEALASSLFNRDNKNDAVTVDGNYLRRSEIDVISVREDWYIPNECREVIDTPVPEPEVIEDLNVPAEPEKIAQAYETSISSMMLNGDDA